MVANVNAYPSEFYLFWTDFEPFTPGDCLAMQYLMAIFCTQDWSFELMRERLTAVYPKDVVD